MRRYFFILFLSDCDQINVAHLYFISSLTYIYRLLLVILYTFYSSLFYILFLYLPILPGSPALFLAPLGKSDSGVRDDTLFLYSRGASLRGTARPADSRTKNHNRGSRGDPRGSPDLPRRRPSRFDEDSCGSPAERRWKVETTDGRGVRDRKDDGDGN